MVLPFDEKTHRQLEFQEVIQPGDFIWDAATQTWHQVLYYNDPNVGGKVWGCHSFRPTANPVDPLVH